MKIAITGASGLIGSVLVPALRADGHEVLRLVRREPRPGPEGGDEVGWNPKAGTVDLPALAGVDAVVHLAGAGVGDRRWTAAYKRELIESRVQGTTTISAALAGLSPAPRVLLSGSGMDAYGDPGPASGDRDLDESQPRGEDFLAEMVQAWEASTAPAEAAGIRVVHLRTGLVVSGAGGLWGRRLFPLFRFGLGGRIGSGRQYVSFVSLADELRAIRFLLTADELSGPVNITAPYPATNAELTRAMSRVLGRPALVPVPPFGLKLVAGEVGTQLLRSTRVVPRRLLAAGFEFRHPRIEDAVRAAWAERSDPVAGRR